MSRELTVEMLPAADGDAIVVTCRWEDGAFNLVVDGGRVSTEPRLRERLGGLGRVDLLVVTHIDGDHIGGIVELMRRGSPVPIDEIWFNGLAHLSGGTEPSSAFRDLAPADGVALTEEIHKRELRWNASFGGGPVCVEAEGQAVRKPFGPVTIDVISPDLARLGALTRGERAWTEDTQARRVPARFRALGEDHPDVLTLAATPDREDDSVTNGTSIAFVLGFGAWRVLLAADAHPAILSAGLGALGATPDAPLSLSACKLSHHGGRWNTSRSLLALMACDEFLISSDGKESARPHDETLAKVVTSQAGRTALRFNHSHRAASRWDLEALKAAYGYDVLTGDLSLRLTDADGGEDPTT